MKKKVLIMVSNNSVKDPYLHSQLLDIYRDSDIFEKHYLFCGSANEKKLLDYAYIVDNGNSMNSVFKYVKFYWNLLKLAYKNRKNDVTFHLRGFVGAILFYFLPGILINKNNFIYDPRGAFIIEKEEEKGAFLLTRLLKIMEKKLIKNSLFTIVTTIKFKELFESEYGFSSKYQVCYNSSSISPRLSKANLEKQKTINICYCGSINYWHDLDEISRLIKYVISLFDQPTNIFFFTQEKNKAEVESKFSDLPNNKLKVDFVSYSELEFELDKMDICISVVRPTKSTAIASPIKISDYIMLNKYIILNRGIGDFDSYYKDNNSALLYDYKEPFQFSKKDILRLQPQNNNVLAEKLQISANRKKIINRIQP